MGGQTVTSNANLEVQECLPVSKLFNKGKRSKEQIGHSSKTGKVMTVLGSEILSSRCFSVNDKVINFRMSVKYVFFWVFFFMLPFLYLIPSSGRLASVPC